MLLFLLLLVCHHSAGAGSTGTLSPYTYAELSVLVWTQRTPTLPRSAPVEKFSCV